MRKGESSSETKFARLRVERKLGQRELAESSGVNIRKIQQIESGAAKIESVSLKNALRLADAMGIHPRDFLE